jgi:hypothetical protein
MQDSVESRAATMIVVGITMAWVIYKIVGYYLGDE